MKNMKERPTWRKWIINNGVRPAFYRDNIWGGVWCYGKVVNKDKEDVLSLSDSGIKQMRKMVEEGYFGEVVIDRKVRWEDVPKIPNVQTST